MIPKLSRNSTCRKCEWNIGEAVEQEEKLCDEVGIVREFVYLGECWLRKCGCCDCRNKLWVGYV